MLAMVVVLSGCGWLRPEEPRSPRMPLEGQPPGLTAQWFGVSTLLIGDGQHAILIDGFFSRPPLHEVLFGPLEPYQGKGKAAIDAALAQMPAAIDLILVSHGHYDHALDLPVVATLRKEALVAGSDATLNLVRAAGVPRRRLCAVTHGDHLRLGQFDIEVFRTPHAPTLLHGAIEEDVRPMHALGYKPGANFSFLLRHPAGRVLIVPSANSAEGMLQGAQADTVFLGIAGLGTRKGPYVDDYWREAVLKPAARLVIPVHWDNFMRPFASTLSPFPAPLDDVEATLAGLRRRAGSAIDIRLMPLTTPVALPRTEHPPSGNITTPPCPGAGRP